MFFEENSVIEEKPKQDFDQLDSELIDKLRKNEINVDEIVKNLEKLYKGEICYFKILEKKLINLNLNLQTKFWIAAIRTVHQMIKSSHNVIIN